MVLFFPTNVGIKAIPIERIYSVQNVGRRIFITYDEGSVVYVDENNLSAKVETAEIVYNTYELADEKMNEFFRCVNRNFQAFMF